MSFDKSEKQRTVNESLKLDSLKLVEWSPAKFSSLENEYKEVSAHFGIVPPSRWEEIFLEEAVPKAQIA